LNRILSTAEEKKRELKNEEREEEEVIYAGRADTV
jgi:hypothetical protein